MQNIILITTLFAQIGPSNMYLLQKNTLTAMAVSALFVLIFSSHGGYAQCSQNNFAVIELQFLDANGKIFDPDLHQPGDIVQGRVYAIFSGSSTNAFFPLQFNYTEEINGVMDSSPSTNCVQNTTGTSTNAVPKGELVYLFEYEFVWGSETFFKDIYMTWRTNDGQTTCRTNDANGQCFSSPEGLRLSAEISPLPVVWLDFSSQVNNVNQTVQLNWSTAKEWDSAHFLVQRSENGIENFQDIGSVKSVGWSETVSHYTFSDEQLPQNSKRLYYRLVQVDIDGNREMSKTILVDAPLASKAQQHWQVFPNPMQDNSLQLNFRGARIPDQVEIRIFALSSNKKITIQPRGRHTEIGHLLQDFPKGVLIMEVVSADTVEIFKIIKK